MVSTASVLKPVMTHQLNLVGKREECTEDRVVTVEQNSATGDSEPQQECRQRARRQNRLGTVKLQSVSTPSPEILPTYPYQMMFE